MLHNNCIDIPDVVDTIVVPSVLLVVDCALVVDSETVAVVGDDDVVGTGVVGASEIDVSNVLGTNCKQTWCGT